MRSKPRATEALASRGNAPRRRVDLRRSVLSLACGAGALRAFLINGSERIEVQRVELDGATRSLADPGPATGEAHRRLRERIEDLILILLAESEAGGAEAPATER